MSLPFSLPEIEVNAFGWGPSNVQEEMKDLPYAQYSKSDKLGKIADWGAIQGRSKQYDRDRSYQSSVMNTTFSIQADEETSFHLVDNTKAKPTTSVRIQKNTFNRNTRPKDSQYMKIGSKQQNRSQGQKGKSGRVQKNTFKPSDSDIKTRESIKPGSEWKVLDEFDFNKIAKFSYEVSTPEDVVKCGSVHVVDKSNDRVTPSKPKVLKSTEKVFYKVTTQEDPVIQKLVEAKEATVFTTDSIASVLMTCPRSVYSWDIVVTKKNGVLFFDKRDSSSIDSLTVHETSMEPPNEDSGINSPDSLSREATITMRSFSQVMIKEDKVDFEESNPFGTECAQTGYRYRRWGLDKDVSVIIRTEVDYLDKNGATEVYGSIKSLNEYDPKTSQWKKLESQPGSVFASEIKNNSCKIAKWLCQSHLAGINQMKIGFISRANVKESNKHYISFVQTSKPQDLASQMNLSVNQCWGIFNAFVQYFLAKEDGTYVIIKDPAKAALKIYSTKDDLLNEEVEES